MALNVPKRYLDSAINNIRKARVAGAEGEGSYKSRARLRLAHYPVDTPIRAHEHR